jgi:hypothetical protein
MTKHEKLMRLVESQDATSRPKDPDQPAPVQDLDSWVKRIRAHYTKTAPVPHPAPVERKYQTFSEDLNTPALPAGAHEKFRRMVRR